MGRVDGEDRDESGVGVGRVDGEDRDESGVGVGVG